MTDDEMKEMNREFKLNQISKNISVHRLTFTSNSYQFSNDHRSSK